MESQWHRAPADDWAGAKSERMILPARWAVIAIGASLLLFFYRGENRLFCAVLLLAAIVYNATAAVLLKRGGNLAAIGYISVLFHGILCVLGLLATGGINSTFHPVLTLVLLAAAIRLPFDAALLMGTVFLCLFALGCWLVVNVNEPGHISIFLGLNTIALIMLGALSREQAAAKEALAQSEERYRLLIEGVKDYALYMIDAKGRVVNWNIGGERISGHKADEVVGKHFGCFYPPEDVKAGKPDHEICLAIEAGHHEDEGWRLRKDGSRFWASDVTTPLCDANGKLWGFARVTRDTTERRRFVQIAAHELRNPIAGVKGILSLLRQRVADGKPLQNFDRLSEVMEREIDRLSVLIGEILEAFYLQEGRLETKRMPVDLEQVVQAALSPYLVSAEGSRLVCRTCPGMIVLGDAHRLEEVIRNLLSNAFKYSSAGSPIEVVLSSRGGQADVFVRDTGVGIPREQIGRVFEVFFRGSNLAGRDPGGMGLGLYISKAIVEEHGGRIWAESEEGTGSVFHVELPLYPRKEVS